MSRYAHITGWGKALPEKIMTNHDIAKLVDTNDEWIRERTGIERRHIAGPDDSVATLGAEAALNALKVANLPPSEIDLIIVATCTPEYLFPATANIIQDMIGATKAGGYDILAACSGFIYALNTATQIIRGGAAENALVIGSETLSRVVDWTDRNTCILFGDGAGAFVLQGSDRPGGVVSSIMRSDGSGGDTLIIPGGGSKHPASQATLDEGLNYIKMNGREVFRFATRVMAKTAKEVIEKANLEIDDIALIIPHQANKRIIEAAARGLDLPMDRIMVNVQDYGNTSTATIPIATVEAIEQGRLKPRDNTVMVGFGGGLTWGAAAIIWTGPFSETQDRRVFWGWLQRFARVRSWLLRVRRQIEGLIWGRKNTPDGD